jgi:hypothetical protein
MIYSESGTIFPQTKHELGKADVRQPTKPYKYLKDKAFRQQFFGKTKKVKLENYGKTQPINF